MLDFGDRRFRHTGLIDELLVSPDGRRVGAVGDNDFSLFDADTGEAIFRTSFDAVGEARNATFEPDGRHVLVSINFDARERSGAARLETASGRVVSRNVPTKPDGYYRPDAVYAREPREGEQALTSEALRALHGRLVRVEQKTDYADDAVHFGVVTKATEAELGVSRVLPQNHGVMTRTFAPDQLVRVWTLAYAGAPDGLLQPYPRFDLNLVRGRRVADGGLPYPWQRTQLTSQCDEAEATLTTPEDSPDVVVVAPYSVELMSSFVERWPVGAPRWVHTGALSQFAQWAREGVGRSG